MQLRVSYMGTKRKIADRVACIVAEQSPGPLLDAFSGMCAVSFAVGQSRAVWCNDVQTFAASVATAFFTSRPLAIDNVCIANLALTYFRANETQLRDRFAGELASEDRILSSDSISEVHSLERSMPNVSTCIDLEIERVDLAVRPKTSPYRLFTITYSGGYFGLSQSIEIDSLRFAIDQLLSHSQIDEDSHRWLCLAVCQAARKVATTTGHFAQYLRVNDRNFARFVAQRRRSIWTEWLRALYEVQPVGTVSWRATNRVFQQDAITLLHDLEEGDIRPSVVYADPPYTRDQYSRYYHIYETLLLYDYPASHGSGRYRPDRFRSPYSMKTRVYEAFNDLIATCSILGSSLVLSYPERGVLEHPSEVIPHLVLEHYGRPPKTHSIEATHSSFGASKGQQNYTVQEQIYVAH